MVQLRRRNRRPCDACKRRKTGCYRIIPTEPCDTCKLRNIPCVTGGTKAILPSASSQVLLDVHPGGPRAFYEMEHEDAGEHVACNIAGPLDVDGTDFKSLFVGFSGDYDPWLLKKFQDINRSIKIPRREARSNLVNVATEDCLPAFFSTFPRRHLDSRPGEYCVEAIERTVEGHSQELLETYFLEIYPSFPVFSKRRFESQYEAKRIRATLLSVIYVLASNFCDRAKDLLVLEDFLAKAVPLEARAATLQTVLCMLLYLQLPPNIIREPNYPGHWTLTASLVAQSQELGLNIDCSNWSIPSLEKKERKKLWWAVFVQDKWESLGLSRPSHIAVEDSNVPKLQLSDLDDSIDCSLTQFEGFTTKLGLFIGLCELSIILSHVLKDFYSVSAIQRGIPDFSNGLKFLREVKIVEAKFAGLETTDGSSRISFLLCITTLQLAICRRFLSQSESYTLIEPYARDAMTSLIMSLKRASIMELNGPWWSYSRVNFALVGSILIFLHFASTRVPESRYDWLDYIKEYGNILSMFSRITQVTKLANLRYENLLNITGVLETEGRASKNLESIPAESPIEQLRENSGDPELFLELMTYIGV